MANRSKNEAARPEQPEATVTRIGVAGFKSIREEQSIELRPLTVLAGANCAGKSSMVQPLLLLKQTLEATYDPGPLLLAGPNVRFTDATQLLSRTLGGEAVDGFHVAIEFRQDFGVATYFRRLEQGGFEISKASVVDGVDRSELSPGMSAAQIRAQLPRSLRDQMDKLSDEVKLDQERGEKLRWRLERERCFLRPRIAVRGPKGAYFELSLTLWPVFDAESFLRNIVHLPAVRGNPLRNYPVTAVGGELPGTFESYVASVIAKWQADKARRPLKQTCEDLRSLGLSWKVEARPISDAEVELQVGRLPRAVRGGSRDLVNIADVGFGVSQALPVVVALHAAAPNQLVYLEQPEIHLHPRAQVAMAGVLARAVTRGVRVLIETHSGLLLLALQHLVASGTLSPDLVKLHWFTRSETDGATRITSADLDEAGAFGDWPEDFGDVELDLEKRYLDAAEARTSNQ
jgi:predicted ATPase